VRSGILKIDTLTTNTNRKTKAPPNLSGGARTHFQNRN